MSNYKIVTDKKILLDFIEWLPELKENEKYYLCLFARNKYCKELTHIKSDKAQLKRFVSDKTRLYEKIKQLEIKKGCYKQKDFEVPESALALYITINPRNMYNASINTMVKLANSIKNQNVSMNPHQEAMSEIQKSKSRNCYVDFDFDYKGPNNDGTYKHYLKEWIFDRIGYNNRHKVKFLETRGGYHVLIDPNDVELQYKKTWHQSISKNQYLDQSGDLLIPVPGTNQGLFTPKFI